MTLKKLGGFCQVLESNSKLPFLVSDDGNILTYGDVIDLGASTQFAKVSGRLTLCLLENSVECLSGFFALSYAGAVVQLVNPEIEPRKLKDIIELYKPEFIWARNTSISDMIQQADVKLGEPDQSAEFTLIQLDQRNELIDSRVRFLLPTSGSTGSPKYVGLSEENLVSNAFSIKEYLALSSSDTTITTLPPTYSYGLSVITSHVVAGGRVVVTNHSLIRPSFWDAYQNFDISGFNGVPYHYELLAKLSFGKLLQPGLRYLTQAGGKMPAPRQKLVSRFASENKIQFFMMYGQTEASPRISYLRPDKSEVKFGCIGGPIPGVKMALFSEQSEKIFRPYEVGELNVDGPNVFLGYVSGGSDLVEMPDRKKGWYSTGDLAYFDDDHDFFIVGRKKRFVKLFGLRFGLDEIENILLELGLTAACVGDDESIKIFIESAGAELGEVKKYLAKKLKLPPKLIDVIQVDLLPRLLSGKVDYLQLTNRG